MFTIPWQALGAAVALAAHLGAQAQPALTLDRALQLAQARSQQLVAQGASAAAAREMAVAAGQLPDPTLKAGVSNLPLSGPERFSLTRDFMTMSTLSLMQEFTRSDKRLARAARFEREADAAEAARLLALANLRRDTAMAWLDRHFSERMLEVLRQQRTEATLQVDAADAAYRGARGTQTEAFAARSMVAAIDDRMRQIELQVATAKTRLARWVGDAAGEPLGAPPALANAGLTAASLDARVSQHPDVVMMARQEAMAQADAAIARSNQRADWGVEVMYSQRGSAYANMVSIAVSIPLQLDPKQRQDRELAARLAVVEQMRAQREEGTRERLAEARSWLQAWHSGRDRLAHYDRSLLPLAAERTRSALVAYRGGSGALSTVLEARRGEIDTQLDRLRLEMETAALWARLEHLIPAEQPMSTPPRGVAEK